ncbi:hypothetical protein U0070_008974, partial [Myodes glareolus]
MRWHLEQKEKARHMVLMARESQAGSRASVCSGEACCEEGWLLKTVVGHQGFEQGQQDHREHRENDPSGNRSQFLSVPTDLRSGSDLGKSAAHFTLRSKERWERRPEWGRQSQTAISLYKL